MEKDDELFKKIKANITIILKAKGLDDKAISNISDLLDLYIQMICKNITIQTNRKKFPEDLSYIVVDMVIDRYEDINGINDIISKYYSDVEEAKNNLKIIQSMSEKDRSITYSDNTLNVCNAEVELQKTLIAKKFDAKLEEYRKLINRYRLVYRT